MIRIVQISISLAFFFLTGCTLEKLEPAQTAAFIKYFGEDGNTEARDLVRLPDGYLLLGVNTARDNRVSTLLIKTDLLGNRLWAVQIPDVNGRALAAGDAGYFVAGDSITSNNLLFGGMILIQTDSEGGILQTATRQNDTVSFHATGLTLTTSGQLVVCGYTRYLNTTDSVFLAGYNTDLSTAWPLQMWGTANTSRTTFSQLFEASNGDLVWASLNNQGSNITLTAMVTPPGAPDHRGSLEDLFGSNALIGIPGGLEPAAGGGAMLAQTVRPDASANTAIGLALFNTGSNVAPVETFVFAEEGNNVFAGRAITATDGSFVMLGYTDKHPDNNQIRTDYDLYLRKTGSAGFTRIIGGTGNETGAALLQAADGGYVILATMENTNEVKLMMLVKTDRKGELVNE